METHLGDRIRSAVAREEMAGSPHLATNRYCQEYNALSFRFLAHIFDETRLMDFLMNENIFSRLI